MKALGIFTFAGLMTEGVKQVFDVPYVINPGYGNITHSENHPSTEIYNLDVYPAIEPDFIYAQPECAPWSNAGKSLGLADPRLASTIYSFNAVEKYKPGFFALESVVAAFTKGREFYDAAAERMQQSGYFTYHLLLNNKYHGVPQNRLRYFFIASRKPLVLSNLTPAITCEQALNNVLPGGYELLKGSAAKALMKYGYTKLKPGMRLCKWFNQVNKNTEYDKYGRVKGRPPFGDVRLNGGVTANTFTGHYSMIHFSENRAITMQEAKALCGVNSNYYIEGNTAEKQSKLLARSVMPGMGKWIATTAALTLDETNNNMQLSNVIDLRQGQYNLI